MDDDVAGREMVAATLSRHGAEVLTAGSAPGALDLLRRHPVQVLLADLAMPGEDGYSLIRNVRALEEPVRSVPAAALTALVRAEDQERARLAGFDIHVPKPVDPDALVNVVSLLTRVRRRLDE